MAEKLGTDQVVTVEELVVSHSFEMAALVTLLERKGILTRQEVVAVIKELRDSV